MIHHISRIVLAFSFILLASGCESQRNKDLAAIDRAVETMRRLPVPRKPDQGVVNAIDTAKGRLLIATCGATKTPKGEWVAMGPSRDTGFFILPRAIWVDDIEEARKLLLEDYETGKLLPLPEMSPAKPTSPQPD